MSRHPGYSPTGRQVLFEFVYQGAYVKVSAIDPETGTEVSIVGDPTRGREALKWVAANKLAYVLKRGGAKGGGATR
ncbi:DUF6898 family protein [Roseospirillum parvum]|uniref:DUF6898 domain-containing protein n=1 Tax=Roseospirillum parvum TaxID=83401 RepID=A0A1G7Y4U6_9PROT|nr:hypothetical protein [Roseospirillum parvum]SDG91461.1 hypothetical protein SAMN05421742_103188 [Roseospirillum parvum]